MTSGFKIGLAVVGLLIAVPVGCSLIGTVNSVATAPSRVVNKTLQTDNIISQYNGFFARKVTYDARLSQIVDQKASVKDNTDPAEASRLRIELNAMRASCREMALSYNADAVKANTSIFRSGELPATLSESACNA